MEYQQRRQIIEGLLDHWQDFVLPSVGGPVFSDGAEGVGVLFTSGMNSYPSVVELGRVLGVFGRVSAGPFSRFCDYWAAPKRQTEVKRRVRVATGWAVKEVPAMVRLVPWQLRNIPVCDRRYAGDPCPCGNVLPRTVCTAVDFLLGVWNDDVPLELPPALTRKLTEFTDQDGTHLTEAA